VITAPEHFNKKGWALVPGPVDIQEQFSSLDLREQVEYSPLEIAKSLLHYPGMQLLNEAKPTWWDWKARWESGEQFLELDITLMGKSDDLWEGSEIRSDCSAEVVIALWKHLKTTHAGIWLHSPDCVIHTESSFRKEFNLGA
jgi:hypothetical protein